MLIAVCFFAAFLRIPRSGRENLSLVEAKVLLLQASQLSDYKTRRLKRRLSDT